MSKIPELTAQEGPIGRLFSSEGFIPHGHCYLWNPSLLRLHIISDALITLAYLTIPLTLVYVVRRRKDVPFDWIFLCFSIFIVACGLTHAMEIWSIWHATYWLSGSLKAVTALASITTAALLIKLIPQLLAIPSPNTLRQANRALENESLERKRAEEALQQLERQRLDDILNSVPAMVFECFNPVKAGQRVNFVSNYIERMLDYTPEEWNATPDFWFSRIHPDDRDRVAADSAEVFAGRPPETIVSRWLAKDGRVVQGETHLVHMHDEAGQIIGARGFTVDVTERQRAEEELRWKTALYEAQVNSSLDGILVVDDQGKKILQNRKFGDLWEIPQEILDQHDDQATLQYAASTTMHPERFYERVMYLYANPNETAREEIEFKDGKVLDRYSSPVFDKNGKFYGRIWMFRDITERKRAEAEMERLNKQLVDVSRQAGMAEVATSVLHNVGNVLNSVNVSCSVISTAVRKSRLGNVAKVAGLLRENASDLATFFSRDPAGQQLPDFLTKLAGKLAEEQASILHEIELLGQNIEHIKDIVAMQQSYATVSGVAEIINVEELVEESLRMNAGALSRHEVKPIREYSKVPSITVEKHKVLQILVNLIRNAKYACDESGREDKHMTVRVAGDRNGVRIAVIDNGVGIPAENLTRIFSHGFTTRKDGHGFGLHSAVLAAREMGGCLTAQSAGPGAGATFTLELPISPLKEGAKRLAPEACLAI